MEYGFTKRDTKIVKGIAILAMILHHTYPNNPGIPINMVEGSKVFTLMASSGKICVSLLTILSGYGLAESYKKVRDSRLVAQIKFFLSHYIQFLSTFWCIQLWAYAMAIMRGESLVDEYGHGLRGIRDLLLDLFGLGRVFDTAVFIGDWYVTAIIVFYALFPILFWVVKKLKWFALIIAYIPWVYYLAVNNIDMHTDWWLFYVFSFILGIYFSQTQFLSRQKHWDSKKGVIFSLFLFVFAVVLRAFITMPMDPLLAFSVIELEIFVLSKIKITDKFFHRCGTQAANMWLLHIVIAEQLMRGLNFSNYTMRYLYLLFLCMGSSLVIEEIKAGLHYNNFVKMVRKRLA